MQRDTDGARRRRLGSDTPALVPSARRGDAEGGGDAACSALCAAARRHARWDPRRHAGQRPAAILPAARPPLAAPREQLLPVRLAASGHAAARPRAVPAARGTCPQRRSGRCCAGQRKADRRRQGMGAGHEPACRRRRRRRPASDSRLAHLLPCDTKGISRCWQRPQAALFVAAAGTNNTVGTRLRGLFWHAGRGLLPRRTRL